MLDQKRISIGKLKQAYELSWQDAYSLLDALLPDRVFPYVLWQTAYTEFWAWSVQSAVYCYQVESPSFPDEVRLPDRYFPTYLCKDPIVRFFADISKLADISALERGIDYIIEAAYGNEIFPFKEEKETFFRALHQESNNQDNWTRMAPLKITSLQVVDYFFIVESFFDTIVIDKPAAILHLHSCGYPLRREVKGISWAIAERIVAPAVPPQDNTPGAPSASVILVPRTLWYGKTPQAARDAMAEKDYPQNIIAHILYTRCNIANKTYISSLLGTYPKKVTKFLAEAAVMNIADS